MEEPCKPNSSTREEKIVYNYSTNVPFSQLKYHAEYDGCCTDVSFLYIKQHVFITYLRMYKDIDEEGNKKFV